MFSFPFLDEIYTLKYTYLVKTGNCEPITLKRANNNPIVVRNSTNNRFLVSDVHVPDGSIKLFPLTMQRKK